MIVDPNKYQAAAETNLHSVKLIEAINAGDVETFKTLAADPKAKHVLHEIFEKPALALYSAISGLNVERVKEILNQPLGVFLVHYPPSCHKPDHDFLYETLNDPFCSRADDKGNKVAQIVSLLVAKGANVRARYEQGTAFGNQTPLHLAARYAHAKACEVLLDNGAEIEAKDNEGLTPLHTVCKEANFFGPEATEVTETLLKRGANPAAQDKNGKTPSYLLEQRLWRHSPSDTDLSPESYRFANKIKKLLHQAMQPSETWVADAGRSPTLMER